MGQGVSLRCLVNTPSHRVIGHPDCLRSAERTWLQRLLGSDKQEVLVSRNPYSWTKARMRGPPPPTASILNGCQHCVGCSFDRCYLSRQSVRSERHRASGNAFVSYRACSKAT